MFASDIENSPFFARLVDVMKSRAGERASLLPFICPVRVAPSVDGANKSIRADGEWQVWRVAQFTPAPNGVFWNCVTGLMETSHVIPVLVLGDTLGRTCLPLSIEAQDFRSALDASASESDRSLVEHWYKADALAQPPCYRLQSAPRMVRSPFSPRPVSLRKRTPSRYADGCAMRDGCATAKAITSRRGTPLKLLASFGAVAPDYADGGGRSMRRVTGFCRCRRTRSSSGCSSSSSACSARS